MQYVIFFYSGGTHDSLAWQSTDLYAQLEANGLPFPFYLVGDDAYGCRNWIVTPFPSGGLTRSKSDFNFYQSKTRITIKRSFGVLVSRWGIIRRPLSCSVRHGVSLVRCCMRLHNTCIDDGMPDVEPITRGNEREVRRRDRFQPYRQSMDNLYYPLTSTERSIRARDTNTSRREQLHERVIYLGLRRPATSRHGMEGQRARARARLML
jgi:hypothetical protein